MAIWNRVDGAWVSEPLARLSGKRLMVASADDEDCREFISWLCDAIPSPERPGFRDTFSYGYWPLRLVAIDDEHERVEEQITDGSSFVGWVHHAPEYWRVQHEVCSRFGSPFAPPRTDQLVTVSEGVMTGDPVAGVRYAAPDHMAGWYLTTNRYNGDFATMTLEHMVHLTFKRQDLARFIALAPGYRFHSEPEAKAWRDPKVAVQT